MSNRRRCSSWRQQYFGPVAAHKLPVRKQLTEPEQLGLKQVNIKAPAKLPELAMAWKTPQLVDPVKDVDPYALEVLSGILDGNDSARLPQSLVKNQQVALDVGTDYDRFHAVPRSS